MTAVHDLLPLSFPPEYPRQQYYFRLFVPRILRRSRVVVADSENTRRDIIQRFGLEPGKVRVVYPGYDPDTFSPNGFDPSSGRHADPYCLYVGNLLPHKNLLRLLDALAILRRRQPCRLMIRGEGRPAYARALRERVESLRLRDVVTFLGYLTEDALRDLYSRAACLVLPSLGEGFGFCVLEAMACGTPVVTANTSSLPEVAGDAALLVDPYDVVALAKAMFRVLTDRDLREDLRLRGLQRAGLFVGHVNSNKAIHKVIETIGSNKDLADRVRYVVIGQPDASGDYFKRIDSLIEQYSLRRSVQLLGYQADEVLNWYLSRADIFINLRFPAMEGASWSLAEQLLTERPIIVFNTGFFSEVPDACVVKVTPGHFEGFAERLRELVASEGLRESVGGNGRRFAMAQFSIDRYVTEFADFLEEVGRWRPVLGITDRVSEDLALMGVGDGMKILDMVARELYWVFGRGESSG